VWAAANGANLFLMNTLARYAAPVLLSALLATPATHPVDAAEFSIAEPEDVGMTAKGIQSLDESMRALVDEGRRAGVVWGVLKGGKLVTLEAYGRRDIENDLPMEEDTVFRIYSQTRAVTAAAMLTLLEEGGYSLEDQVADYLPEIGAMEVIAEMRGERVIRTAPQDPKMTIQHLFAYTSGLGYFIDWPKSMGVTEANILDPNGTIETSIRKLSQFPLLSQPGEAWIYGYSSDVLGRIMEVITGQDFNTFLHERLLVPLALKDTGFWIQSGSADRLAVVYAHDGAGELVPTESFPQSTYTRAGSFFSAGGGLVSTVPDYLRFGQMIANGGELDGVRVLARKTVAQMGSNALTAAQLPITFARGLNPPKLRSGYGWGLAIGVRLDAGIHTVPGSVGDLTWGGFADTVFFIDPTLNIVAVAMTQWMGNDNDELGFRLRNGVYGALYEAGRD
jgi:CubicO group peptidase (beta-lactamase class C family)